MLLPDLRRRGEIHFRFFKSLPYTPRLVAIMALLSAGFSAQVLLFDALSGAWFFLGPALLLAASLLGMVRGYTNQPGRSAPKREWRAGDKAQLQMILDIARKSIDWDRSAIDITCTAGCFTLVVAAAVVGAVAVALSVLGYATVGMTLVVDAIVLLLPQWVTGVRRILTNAPLTIKVQNLLHIYAHWEAFKRETEQMSAQLEMAKGPAGEMPTDAKLILQIPSLGDQFLGIQTQVVLNNVQGTDYPYLYCVLVARSGLQMPRKLASTRTDTNAARPRQGLLAELFSFKKPNGITVETKREDDMDILVVRQATTQDSGYHTDSAAAVRIFDCALDLARRLAADPPAMQSSKPV